MNRHLILFLFQAGLSFPADASEAEYARQVFVTRAGDWFYSQPTHLQKLKDRIQPDRLAGWWESAFSNAEETLLSDQTAERLDGLILSIRSALEMTGLQKRLQLVLLPERSILQDYAARLGDAGSDFDGEALYDSAARVIYLTADGQMTNLVRAVAQALLHSATHQIPTVPIARVAADLVMGELGLE